MNHGLWESIQEILKSRLTLQITIKLTFPRKNFTKITEKIHTCQFYSRFSHGLKYQLNFEDCFTCCVNICKTVQLNFEKFLPRTSLKTWVSVIMFSTQLSNSKFWNFLHVLCEIIMCDVQYEFTANIGTHHLCHYVFCWIWEQLNFDNFWVWYAK